MARVVCEAVIEGRYIASKKGIVTAPAAPVARTAEQEAEFAAAQAEARKQAAAAQAEREARAAAPATETTEA